MAPRRVNASRHSAAFLDPHHDHTRCTATAMRTAEEVCAARGTRLTEIRRRVLSAVWRSHAPVGAYDILASLNAEGGKIAPMAVYRALDFLRDHGLVHRLASLNAFIGCAQAEEHHSAHFLICRNCKATAEMEEPHLTRAVDHALKTHGFTAEHQVVEIQGLCGACSAEQTNAHDRD